MVIRTKQETNPRNSSYSLLFSPYVILVVMEPPRLYEATPLIMKGRVFGLRVIAAPNLIMTVTGTASSGKRSTNGSNIVNRGRANAVEYN
jgi:hypothetical protein